MIDVIEKALAERDRLARIIARAVANGYDLEQFGAFVRRFSVLENNLLEIDLMVEIKRAMENEGEEVGN